MGYIREYCDKCQKEQIKRTVCDECSASELNALLSRNKELTDALDKAAYDLFSVKRMGVSDEVAEYAYFAHMAACKILDAER